MALSEDSRRRGALIAAWGGWIGSLALVYLNTMYRDWFPQGFSLVIVLIMMMAVTASLTLSRMRLQEVITEVFVTGLRTATSLHGGTENRIRELHVPLDQDNLPAPICAECAQRWPCSTIQTLDRTG